LVKTRFAPPLSLDQAAELYEAMLADVLVASARAAAEWDLEPVLAFYPPDAANEMVQRTPADFRLQIQRGTGLAERMANAFAEASAAGAPFALLRGSDSPGLGREYFANMIARLKAGDDLVLTPDAGGGYAMVGQRSSHHVPLSALFDVPMSTDEVLCETLDIAEARGLRHSVTDSTFDLDQAGDIRHLDSLSQELLSDLCPRTVESILNLRDIGVL
jgi:hypothetical protein